MHGFQGVNKVSLSGFRREFDTLVIAASAELKDEFSFNLDMNSGYQLGVGAYSVIRI